jgi:hypothetical protein
MFELSEDIICCSLINGDGCARLLPLGVSIKKKEKDYIL